MISHVAIQNYKSLHSVAVDLSPFTVLIGENGSGKSSFLQAMEILGWLVRYNSINEAFSANGLTYNELVYLRGASSRISWRLSLSVPDPEDPSKQVGVVLGIGIAKHKHVYVAEEFVASAGMNGMPWGQVVKESRFLIGRSGRTMFAKEGDKEIRYHNVSLAHSILLDVRQKPKDYPVLSRVADALAGIAHYEIWGPEGLRQSSEGSHRTLEARGQNLPSLLHTLRSQNPEAFGQLVREVQGAYPWLDSIEIRTLGERKYALSFLEASRDQRKRRVRYQPSQVSDGFLRLLALTALKYQPGPLSLVGYEEPENGMHPAMLRECVSRLRDICERGTQVIVTTHSPFLLQEMLSEDVGGDPRNELRLVCRGKDGKTVISKIRQPVWDKARSHGVGVGELWSMILKERDMAEDETVQAAGPQ